MNDDDLPDPLANLDQALAGLALRAKVLRSFFVALVDEGFTEDQALTLTQDYQEKFPA